MIPKKIHYCWFGKGKYPSIFFKCRESWEKYCSDYEIVEWNEENFDVSENIFCREAYQVKKFAFVADYARAKIMYEHGGLYFDTDVEIFKNFDPLLNDKIFLGFEKDGLLAGDTLGAVAGTEFWAQVLKSFDNAFLSTSREPNLYTMPNRLTDVAKVMCGGKELTSRVYLDGELKIYPTEYFQPINQRTGKIIKTSNTFSMHHYSASWYTKEKKLLRFISKILGRRMTAIIKRYILRRR